jgi:hypothetical protein
LGIATCLLTPILTVAISWLLIRPSRRSTFEELVDGETDVSCNLSQQGGRYVSASMKGHRCAAAFSMSELLVRSALSGLNKAEPVEQRDDLARPQDRDGPQVYAI